jgi:hypothetical protein
MNPASLERYWEDWNTTLQAIVKSKNARLHFPHPVIKNGGANREFTVSFNEPICIFNSPTKGSSTKLAKRLCIFIHGHLDFRLVDGSVQLKYSSCVISFFTQKNDGAKIDLTLCESMHFDTEQLDDQLPFHPIFHVQRGLGIGTDSCMNVVRELARRGQENISIDTAGHDAILLKNPYFRIPTPQMDLLTVLTLVVADYFCSSGEESRANSDKYFGSVLALLLADKNPAREGACAARLRGKITKSNHLSVGNWYVETN